MLKVAEEKKKKNGLHDLLNIYYNLPVKQVNDNLIACILILPQLLSEKSEILYSIYQIGTSLDQVKLGLKTPHVAVIECPFRSSLVFIVAEDEILIEGVEFLQSIISTISLYYCCNIKYPLKGGGTYTFVDLKFLKLKHGGIVPRKVVTLCEKLKKLY